jgi:Family of unknown function (DUF6049)
MRRLPVLLCVLAPLTLAAPPVLSAPALEVRLSLVAQSPWVSPDHPAIHLRVRATNVGTVPVTDMSFGITVFTSAHTRTQYDQSLHADPTGAGALFANFDLVPGRLAPGATLPLALSGTTEAGVEQAILQGDQTAVYPTKVELRSGEETVGELRSPIVFLHFPKHERIARTRLRLGWTFVLHRPVDLVPDGTATFRDASLQDSVAPGGRLAREVQALADAANDPDRPQPMDVVWSPPLLSQLDLMRQGYWVENGGSRVHVPAGQAGSADAATVIDAMHRLARGPLVESAAMPFAAPSVPALIQAGLGVDVPVQLSRGRDQVAAFLGKEPADDIFWPPGSYLDQASLSTLSGRGVRTFILDSGLVSRPSQPKEFAQPATAALSNSLTTTATAIVPDDGIQAILESPLPRRDVRLTVQAVLGELAQIWLEQPGVPRAVALLASDRLDLPGGLFGPLLRIVGEAPFVQTQRLGAIVKNFPAKQDPPAQLVPHRSPSFSIGYVEALAAARADIATYRSILVTESPVPNRMEDTVLLAEGDTFSDDQAYGEAFVGGIRQRLQTLFQGIQPDTSRVVTLASGRGVVPLGVHNATDERVRVQIRLVSVRLDPSSEAQTVQLRANSTTPMFFRVKSRTTGRFPVQVRVLTPEGAPLGDPYELVVRSTAYNLVALIVTVGAALFLLVWWARRFIPRTRTA